MTTKKIIYSIFCFCLFFIIACKKEKSPQLTVPELTTTAATSITANTAISGGVIIKNGGETINASGICWSTTNQNPTILDDSTKGTTTSGSFTATLTNLNSSSIYYVRAYAINRIGTGYGNVITFNTGNAAPIATAVSITGTPNANELLMGNYTYSDSENDTESSTTYQWYIANDGIGTGEAPIEGATEKIYKVTDEQEGKYIRFGVTPKAGVGTQNGTEVKSAFIGAVGEATTVTFTYNGAEVTYGIIIGSSGKKWLDRNLGASRVAQNVSDYTAYGDLFQWGRLADGHQTIVRADGTDANASGPSGISTTQSSTDVPSTNSFIATTEGAWDWREPKNNDLWQGADGGINNPCPEGWRVASQDDWTAEGITDINDGYNKLRLTYTGWRDVQDGSFYDSGTFGMYWTSSLRSPTSGFSMRVILTSTTAAINYNNRGNGSACRCVKQ